MLFTIYDSRFTQKPSTTLPIAYYGSILFAMVLYVLIVVVVIGHLPFEALAEAQDRSVAAAACTGALGVMILQILGQPAHQHANWLIAGVMVLPFVYEIGYSQIAGRFVPSSARS